MKIAGIDEAGKGPVIGPLIVCGVCLDQNLVSVLKKLGVKDSKKLSPKRRAFLADKIKEISEFHIVKIDPPRLDELMASKTINDIILDACIEIINRLNPNIVYVDCPHVNISKFKAILEKCTRKKIIADHKADSKYEIVSAASILAKVTRDCEIDKIKKEIAEDFGSGYPSDVRTINFLKRIINEGKDLPWFVRKSWKTTSSLFQRDLSSFLNE